MVGLAWLPCQGTILADTNLIARRVGTGHRFSASVPHSHPASPLSTLQPHMQKPQVLP